MTMNILFCGDANMTDGVLLATLSLMRQTREPLHIFVLTATLTVNDHRYKPFPVATAAQMTKLMQKENPGATVTGSYALSGYRCHLSAAVCCVLP